MTPGPQPETRGANFFAIDRSLRDLLTLYLPEEDRRHLEPHFMRLGALIGDRLDDLAAAADRNPPVLHPRDRQGRDVGHVEKHPAYRELERLAFSEFEMAAMSHRPALGWPKPIHHVAKYTFQYLFSQSEFGLMCPLSMTDSLTRTLRRFGDKALVDRYLPALLAGEADAFAQGAMFMTEQEAGSDVGATVTVAVPDGDAWRLHGDKWFCSNADADMALVLARPEGGSAGTRGLGLFLLPRILPDGTPNRYRVIRLKDKLGTRSMASGEITLNGASAWLVGELERGFVQIAEMINQSRLSNAVRSAGMMRRALHEALCVARGRAAFGRRLVDLPLMQRQLLKIMLPAEEALSMCLFTATALRRADEDEALGKGLRRILTPLVKFRCCRDARKVPATRWRCGAAAAISRNGSSRASCATPISARSGKGPATSSRSTCSGPRGGTRRTKRCRPSCRSGLPVHPACRRISRGGSATRSTGRSRWSTRRRRPATLANVRPGRRPVRSITPPLPC